MPPGLLAVDLADRELATLDGGDGGQGGVFGANIHAVEFAALEVRQVSFEFFPFGGCHLGFDGPIFLGDEILDFGFALANQPQGDGLHTAGRSAFGCC